jgi:hypothetical protein
MTADRITYEPKYFLPANDFAMVFVFTVEVPVGRATDTVDVVPVPVVVVAVPSFNRTQRMRT